MKPVLDFTILDNYDPRYIHIVDNSVWEHIKDKPAIIEIKLPDSEDVITHYFDKGKINTFNSVNLYIGCPTNDCECNNVHEELPDGLYQITVKGSPSTFSVTKSYLRTHSTRMKLDVLSVKKGYEELEQLYTMLESAKASVRAGNDCTTQEVLFTVQDKIANCG